LRRRAGAQPATAFRLARRSAVAVSLVVAVCLPVLLSLTLTLQEPLTTLTLRDAELVEGPTWLPVDGGEQEVGEVVSVGAGAEAFLHRRGHREANKQVRPGNGGGEEEQEEAPLRVPLVELQVESLPWRITKVFVPLSPEVALWWTAVAKSGDFAVRFHHPLTGAPKLEVLVADRVPLEVQVSPTERRSVHRVRGVITLPEGATQDCQVGWVYITADFPPLAGLGPVRALLIVCPLRAPSGVADGGGSGSGLFGPVPTNAAVELLAAGGQHPLRLLLLPWLILLLPCVVGKSIGPLALMGGACLTLASIACISFLLAIVIVLVQRRCAQYAQRWRRLWRLRVLRSRPSLVSEAFGEAGPCCICLAESGEESMGANGEALIALLPCRHAMHEDCYRSWVRSDAYPSTELICPLCRGRAHAIGKVVS